LGICGDLVAAKERYSTRVFDLQSSRFTEAETKERYATHALIIKQPRR
jgi:hypothetical protein